MNKNILIAAVSCIIGVAAQPFIPLCHGQEPPNIMVFIADDMGYTDSEPYGNTVIQTPTMDRMAKEGMLFKNFFLTASSCSPSRSSILTGRYPHNTGAMNLHENLSPAMPILVEPLKEAGYYTMLIGKSHGTNNPKVLDKFDRVDKVNWSKPWEMGDMWVEALKTRPKDQPFFLWAASIDPHRPFKQGEYPVKHDPSKVKLPPYYPDLPEIRKELAAYYDEISRFDRHIAMALEEAATQGELENTLIVIMSDNGRPFAQAKTRINTPGLKSPLIVRYPGLIGKGKVSESLISAVDLAPALLEAANAKPLPGAQGKSFLPVLKNPEKEIRQYVYGEHNWHSLMAFERAVISKEYLFIKNWLPQFEASGPGDVVREPSYQVMRKLYEKGKLADRYSDSFISPRPEEELFDLKKDPHTMKNVAGNPQYKKIYERMTKRLKQWQKRTGDVFPGKENLKPDIINRRTGEKINR